MRTVAFYDLSPSLHGSSFVLSLYHLNPVMLSTSHRNHSNMAFQLWLFLFEPMCCSTYCMESKTNAEIQEEGLSLDTFMKTLGFNPSSRQHLDVYISSHLISPAARLPDDVLLSFAYEYMCKNDPFITIIVRPKQDLVLDNIQIQGPDALHSLIERVRIHGHIWNETGVIEDTERAQHLTFLKETYPYFDHNARVFVQDLAFSMMRGVPARIKHVARGRLVSVCRPFYLGRPYFSERAAADILATPLGGYTLQDVLDVLVRQAERGRRHATCEICMLTPLFLYVFGWTWDFVRRRRLLLRKARDRQSQSQSQRKTSGLVGIFRK